MDQSLTYVVHNSITLGTSTFNSRTKFCKKSKSIIYIAWDTKLTTEGHDQICRRCTPISLSKCIQFIMYSHPITCELPHIAVHS